MKDPRREELTAAEKKSLRDYEEKQFIKWAEAQEKLLCRHGFRRMPNTPFDCHQCAGLEFDKMVESDREFQTHKYE